MKKIDLRVPMLRKDYLYASIGYCLKMLLENQNNRAAFTAIASEVMAQIEPELVSVTEPKYLTQDGWQVEISKRLLVVLVRYYPEIYQKLIAIYPSAELQPDDEAFGFLGEDPYEKFIREFDPEQIEDKYIRAAGRYVAEHLADTTNSEELNPLLSEYLQQIKQNAPVETMSLALKVKYATLLALKLHPLVAFAYYGALEEYLKPIIAKHKIDLENYGGDVMYLADGTEVPYFRAENARRTIWRSQLGTNKHHYDYDYDYDSIFFITNAINKTLSGYQQKSKLDRVLPVCWSFENMGEGKCKVTQYSQRDLTGKKQILFLDEKRLKILSPPPILEFDGLYLRSIKDEETELMNKVALKMLKTGSASH